MKLSIVIPNYNGATILGKNIPRLFTVLTEFHKKTHETIEVIVVDDCSRDESVSILEDEIRKWEKSGISLTLLKNENNRGFSPTVNRGAKHASGEILVLLNTDVYPEEDFISPILPHFDDPECFAVGFMDRSIESGKTVLRGRGRGGFHRGFLVHQKGEVNSMNTLWVNGGSGAFRKSIWDKLEGMDELFAPFYWEDIDLSYRGLKAGYSLLFEKKAVVVHEHAKGAIASTYSPSQVKTIAYRNQIIFSWLNFTDVSLILSHFFWLPIHVVRSAMRLDVNFLKGLFQAFLLLPKIIQSRNRRMKYYRLSDEEVIRKSGQ